MHFELKAYHAANGVTLLRLNAAYLVDATRQAELQRYGVIAVQRQLAD
jgi:hypothetical protein